MTVMLDRLSRPLRDLRISVTDRCNLRCPYCMPREVFGADHQFLAAEETCSFEEITRLCRLFAEFGVEKLRITGGEPLMRPELERLVAMVSQIPGIRDVALTTNGMPVSTVSRSASTRSTRRCSGRWATRSLASAVFWAESRRRSRPDSLR
jgi:cyclic pyranopterin phosphate synthase